jgi:serine/threonine protein kinase
LTDFGLSKLTEVSDSISGTPEYMSPEILRNEKHSFASDWWSFGCFIYELVNFKTFHKFEFDNQISLMKFFDINL